jgi:hypothetical protein
MKILVEDVYKKAVSFLNKEKYEYIVIGGIAVGLLGEPRATGDVDIDILLETKQIPGFLRKAKKAGFKFNVKECQRRATATGTFQIQYGTFHVDFIIASIKLERQAFKRKKKIRLYNANAFFPTPEDMILLKIIPGRPQDLVDAQKVALRHKGKLDIGYLKRCAQELSDETQETRILTGLERILTDEG